MPSPDSHRPDWMDDLEEIADLAAEMVLPIEAPAEPDLIVAEPEAVVTSPAPVSVETAAAAAAAAATAAVPWAGPRRPRRRRLVGTSLALCGASAICAGVLLHVPSAATTPLTSGPAYSTPTPDVGDGGSAVLQPVPLTPASPEPLITPAPLSSLTPAVGAVGAPAPSGVAPASSANITLTPVVIAPRTPAPAPARTSAPAPTAAPTSAPTAAPTPAASPTASPAPSNAVTVRSVSLSVGACQLNGSYWICPETTTITFAPGSQGTLSYSISGTDADCTGVASRFDQAQKTITLPANTTKATVTSALVFAAGSQPGGGAPAPGSTAQVRVTSPSRTTSAVETFGSPSCTEEPGAPPQP